MYLYLYILDEWSLTGVGVGHPKCDDGGGGDEFMAMAYFRRVKGHTHYIMVFFL